MYVCGEANLPHSRFRMRTLEVTLDAAVVLARQGWLVAADRATRVDSSTARGSPATEPRVPGRAKISELSRI
jgi:hypothetical protein